MTADTTTSGAGIAVVDIPGLGGVLRAHQALGDGLDVVLLDGGADVAHEAALKARARRRGLLVLGPAAGVARLGGVGVGVSNVLEDGPVAVIGTSAGAVREVGVLLDREGVGVRVQMGLGARDLSEAVDGAGMRAALERLRRDRRVGALVAVLWPAEPGVRSRLVDELGDLPFPVVTCGVPSGQAEPPEGVHLATTLESAARAAARLCGVEPAPPPAVRPRWVTGGDVCGVFTSAGLCAEAAGILGQHLGQNVHTNLTADLDGQVAGADGHRCVNVGDPRIRGALPHPARDPRVIGEALADLRRRPRVRVVILDVPLGLGAHHDPAGVLGEAIAELMRIRPQLTVVAHVVGTDRDPQGRAGQERALAAVGVRLAGSNAAAARLAAAMVAP